MSRGIGRIRRLCIVLQGSRSRDSDNRPRFGSPMYFVRLGIYMRAYCDTRES
jgi:hypothetical protein